MQRAIVLDELSPLPDGIDANLSSQLGIADTDCVLPYRESEKRWRHTIEIRARYGYREFADSGVQFRLSRWLCAL